MRWPWNKKQPPEFAPECYRLGWASVVQFLRQYVAIEQIIHRDKYYQIPVNPAYVMRSIPINADYRSDSLDCDDYVRIFRGELSKLGYGNLLAMDVSIDTGSGNHALIGFLQNYKLVFGDPQLGGIVTIKYERINRIIL